MDGQNFQNEQNNVEQNGFESNVFEQNNVEQSSAEQNGSNGYNNYYQDFTQDFREQPVVQNTKTEEKNTLAVVSLVLGIISIVTGCCGSGFLFGVGGIICAVFANKQNKTGMGKAGMITSIIGLVLSVAMTIFIVVIYVAAFAASGVY